MVRTRKYIPQSQNSKFVSKDDLWKYETDGRVYFEYNKNFDVDPIEFEQTKRSDALVQKGLSENPRKRSKSKLKDIISENIDPKAEFFKLGCQTQK